MLQYEEVEIIASTPITASLLGAHASAVPTALGPGDNMDEPREA
jgi:hypothetical protein